MSAVHPFFINGEYTDSTGTETYDVISPVTGARIGTIPVPSATDLDIAVKAANEAQQAWARVNVWKRAEICHRVGDALSARVDELARLQTLEQGKPLAESVADIEEAAQLFHLHAEDAVRLHGETMPSTDNSKRMWTFYRPVGTWGIITPWNFPLLMFAEFVAPGLATGNAHVIKPPANAPLSVLKAMEAIVEAGVPAGLVNVLPGEVPAGDMLVRHPGVDAIGFIGSSATGAKIAAAAGLKRSIMECSGNGPLVVLADADLDAAARAAVYGAYLCSGQVCCATERVVVHTDAHDDFVEAVLRAAEDVVLGDPFEAATNLGPLNNEGVAAKMDRHMADARERGARILLGGQHRTGQPTDLYYEFTVVDGVPEDSLLSREESFGPVVPIITGGSDDELLRIANDDELGLQGAVFTQNMASAYRFVEELAVGQVVINDSTCFWDINMPFGGAGNRGTGWGRIGGKHTLLDMSDLRTGVMSL
ncbi:aldehyde dehydrogenase family protein [Streptomyces colonosanans]|uniref:Aldehyde dehydrogenase n=1 Tax=Streptomyces colonosanans TaxID=1428652 RepID=A0A1S2PTJ3_9ACTN|nr:aldehyde dehydrogenase family protein [Streptomyces colonosanans]OIJ96892.1 aldehyde dehydrogenase [Streptomyces colonosanans]